MVIVVRLCVRRTKKPEKKIERTRIKEVRCYRGMSGRIEGKKLGQEEKGVGPAPV
jgi:hypothetical protein